MPGEPQGRGRRGGEESLEEEAWLLQEPWFLFCCCLMVLGLEPRALC